MDSQLPLSQPLSPWQGPPRWPDTPYYQHQQVEKYFGSKPSEKSPWPHPPKTPDAEASKLSVRKKSGFSQILPDTLETFFHPPLNADNLFVNRNNPSAQAPSRLTQYSTNSKEFHLEMLTQPLQSIATEWTNESKPRSHKKRKTTEWPLEPAPVVAFRISNGVAEATDHAILTSCPNVFCIATLTNSEGVPVSSELMRGRHSSSLFKLEKEKSPNLNPKSSPTMGVFLFDQIHIRRPGTYCLLFTLFEMQTSEQGMHAVVHNVIRSDPFTVLPQPKRLPKPEPPADILLALAAQGAKIKIRKPNEDRVKRKQDWSLNANNPDHPNNPDHLINPDWRSHTHMRQPPVSMSAHDGHMMQHQSSTQQQPNYSQAGPMPMSLPAPMGMGMPMTTGTYHPLSMPAPAPGPMSYVQQQQSSWLMSGSMGSMAHDITQNMNFGGGVPQDPNEAFMFNGSNPQQYSHGINYSNDSYGNDNYH